MAILDAIDRDLDERGVVDRGGKARSILNHRARISRQLDHWLTKISPAIDRQTADNRDGRQIGRPDYIRELQRIALGDDSTATARDRLSAIEKLSQLESSGDSVTHVTLNFLRAMRTGILSCDRQIPQPSPKGEQQRPELEVPD